MSVCLGDRMLRWGMALVSVCLGDRVPSLGAGIGECLSRGLSAEMWSWHW